MAMERPGSVPQQGGVYALFDGDKNIVYIGLGISRGGGIYKECGISKRLLAHVITRDHDKGGGSYKPQEKWGEVVDIGAIGFPGEYAYLAAALEDYLIGDLNPPRNRVKKRAGSE